MRIPAYGELICPTCEAFRGSVLRVLHQHVLAVFRPPVLQYSQYSGVRNVLDTPSILGT